MLARSLDARNLTNGIYHGRMDRKPTRPQLNWTAGQMDYKKNGQTDYWM